MIKKHLCGSKISKISTEEYLKFFTNMSDVVSKLIPVDEVLLQILNKEDVDEDDIYDDLDDFVCNINYDVLRDVARLLPAKILAYNKYLQRSVNTLITLVDNVKHLVKTGRTPDETETALLHKEFFSAIGGLTFFMVKEFDMHLTLMQSERGDADVTVDEIVRAYCSSFNLDIPAYCNNLCTFSEAYRYHLDLFDEYPDLEEEFLKVVGPDYYNIPEGFLTKEIVDGVIAGTINFEDLKKEFSMDSEVEMELEMSR